MRRHYTLCCSPTYDMRRHHILFFLSLLSQKPSVQESLMLVYRKQIKRMCSLSNSLCEWFLQFYTFISVDCPAGTYSAGNGSCVYCDPGHYQDQVRSSSCIQCPEGKCTFFFLILNYKLCQGRRYKIKFVSFLLQ